MKKYIYAAMVGMITTLAITADAGSRMTSSDYFTIREKLNKTKLTDYQAKKACEIINGNAVDFQSRVVSVDDDGMILADMDIQDILSIPEIFIHLDSDDETASVKSGQTIRYTGVITNCKYRSTIGVLALSIANGDLRMHY